MQEIFIQGYRRYLARALMRSYMKCRIEQGAEEGFEEQHRKGIEILEQKGCPEDARMLQMELPRRTEELSESGLKRAIHAVKSAIVSGKL